MNAFEMVRISMERQQPQYSYAQLCQCGERYAYRAFLNEHNRTQYTERCATCDLQREARQ